MSKFTQTLCVLFTFVSLFWNATRSRPPPELHASAPAKPPMAIPSCDSIKFKIKDCSPYLKRHSSMAEPGTSCCLGLMDAWKDIINSDCSDQVFKSIANLRHVNETRVAHVSSACGSSDLSLDDYLASLLEARADKAKADKAEADEAERDEAEAYQDEEDEAKPDEAEVEKFDIVFYGVATVIVVVLVLGFFCSR